jgi:hypothetical protein
LEIRNFVPVAYFEVVATAKVAGGLSLLKIQFGTSEGRYKQHRATSASALHAQRSLARRGHPTPWNLFGGRAEAAGTWKK